MLTMLSVYILELISYKRVMPTKCLQRRLCQIILKEGLLIIIGAIIVSRFYLFDAIKKGQGFSDFPDTIKKGQTFK